ncbi:MAG: hypothetical protein KAH25_12605, partial [Bacteroidales bacterium]|nr:hypothetical protein [Bacteroidales bacterium]
IIRVDGKKDFSDKVKVARIERTIQPSNQTYQEVYVKANEFASKCNDKDFDAVVEEMKLSKRVLDNLSAMQEQVPGQKDGRQIIIWAYKQERALNDINLFDMNGSYLVTTLSKITDEGYSSLEDEKQNISSAVKNLKKADIIIAKMNESANKENLTKMAAEFNTTVETASFTFETRSIPNFGPEEEVIGIASTMTKDQTVGPIKGSKAVFMLNGVSATPAKEKDDYKATASQFSNRFLSSVNYNLYKSIEDQSDITDNRHLFY